MTDDPLNLRASVDSLTRNLLECYEELDLIYRVAGRILTSGDIAEQLASIQAEAVAILETDAAWFELADGYGAAVPPAGLPPGGPVRRRLVREVIAPALRNGRSGLFGDLRTAFAPGPPDAAVPSAFICSVLRTERQTYGALCLGRLRPGADFTAAEFKLANTLGTFASLALDNHAMYREKLRQEQARFQVEEEIRLAARIQQGLLPAAAPDLPGYSLAGRSLPARQVGGDYFDFIPLDDGRLALCVADVSGKGLPAALLMTGVQATVRTQALQEVPAAECVRRSNHLLFHSAAGMFVTLVYGILDPRRHLFCYTNAGHPPPLLAPASGRARWLDAGGMILGVDETTAYEEECVPLEPGDALVIYSDGISEAEDGTGAEFGALRLARLVRATGDRPASELLDRVLAAVDRHSAPAPPRDDRTLVIVRRVE